MYSRQLQEQSGRVASAKEAAWGLGLMDDKAFVESLFAPEMRSAVSLFPYTQAVPSCDRTKAHGTLVPPPRESGHLVPPPPNSLVGGGIGTMSFALPSDDPPLFVRLNEDDMFTHMLTEHDFADVPKKESEGCCPKTPSKLKALALEPLDLPRNNDTIASMDAFCHMPPFRATSSGTCATYATPSSTSYGVDATLMPVFATNGQVYYGNYDYPPLAAAPAPSPAWVHEDANGSTAAKTQLVPQSMAPVTTFTVPSPGAVDMLHLSPRPPQATPWSTPPRPAFSSPSSLTTKALTELVVSADLETLSPASARFKRPRFTSRPGRHGHVAKGKKCVEGACLRRAQSNSRCKAHGGGARCQYTGPGGCSRSSQGGGFCRAHGGGKRCDFPGCPRGQQRKGRCYVHGGIRKCQFETCEKKDRGNGFCIAHGGGKRCQRVGCARAVRRGSWCQSHEESGTGAGLK